MFESIIHDAVAKNREVIKDYLMEGIAEAIKDYVENCICCFDYDEIIKDHIEDDYSLSAWIDEIIAETCRDILAEI